ncbi:glutamate 5-kinase [Peptoniphilus indolicus]|uniref:Glutamate 5-kinase n=2 Tax=Peptoniphilus indolicus TaxID=33030 RepID=G4D703_9FIRM|nr:glutamate 5-kinase [Peptoniphilus indolicus]EGY76319.1 glutamate 5-kinase [Peptoniphilus indolicus ATCC 29427]SUB75983.1 Glutamate 5-kinase [Peptoniphilus indolicus]
MRNFSNKLEKIVIKIGSSSITHKNGAVNIERIEELAKEISNIQDKGINVVLVSSGAIACGAKQLGMGKRPRDTIGKQATSAVGQVALMNTYNRAFGEYGYKVGQVLLTKVIETDEKMSENARNTFDQLMKMDVVPIVNENDTISTFEIMFGDNDTLSAVVARLIDADLLILLSDIDGLYTDDPNKNSDVELIKEVNIIDENLKSMAKDSDSSVGTGGMATKIKACTMCMEKGIDVVIANSDDLKNVRKIVRGDEIGTIFKR